jgi:hypothetical protein
VTALGGTLLLRPSLFSCVPHSANLLLPSSLVAAPTTAPLFALAHAAGRPLLTPAFIARTVAESRLSAPRLNSEVLLPPGYEGCALVADPLRRTGGGGGAAQGSPAPKERTPSLAYASAPVTRGCGRPRNAPDYSLAPGMPEQADTSGGSGGRGGDSLRGSSQFESQPQSAGSKRGRSGGSGSGGVSLSASAWMHLHGIPSEQPDPHTSGSGNIPASAPPESSSPRSRGSVPARTSPPPEAGSARKKARGAADGAGVFVDTQAPPVDVAAWAGLWGDDDDDEEEGEGGAPAEEGSLLRVRLSSGAPLGSSAPSLATVPPEEEEGEGAGVSVSPIRSGALALGHLSVGARPGLYIRYQGEEGTGAMPPPSSREDDVPTERNSSGQATLEGLSGEGGDTSGGAAAGGGPMVVPEAEEEEEDSGEDDYYVQLRRLSASRRKGAREGAAR